MDDTLSSLHLLVLAALFVGASDKREIGARLGLNGACKTCGPHRG